MMIDMDCACGCGQQTPIAKRTRRPRGQIKGQPMKFVNVAHASLRQSDERLWGKVTKHSGDGCWLWMGAKNNKGYGVISVAGRLTLAHRLAWDPAGSLRLSQVRRKSLRQAVPPLPRHDRRQQRGHGGEGSAPPRPHMEAPPSPQGRLDHGFSPG